MKYAKRGFCTGAVLVAGTVLVAGSAQADLVGKQSHTDNLIHLAQAEPNQNILNQDQKAKKKKQNAGNAQQGSSTQSNGQQQETVNQQTAPAQENQSEAEAKKAEREAQKAKRKAARQAERKAARQAERKAARQAERKAQRELERKQKKAEQKAKRKQAQSQNAASGETVTAEEVEEKAAEQAVKEAKQPAKVSDQAAKPKRRKKKSVEAQIESAAEEPVAVVPDDLTNDQRRKLANAEKRRRAERRKKRRELIGAAAAGIAIGAVLPQLGGRVAADEGDRFVIERNGKYYVRKDDSFLVRQDGSRVEYEQLRRGRVRETIIRPNGARVITVRDPGGTVLRRVKVRPNGDRIVLYDFRDNDRIEYVDYDRRLPPLRVRRPLDEYIVSARRADRRYFYETFRSEPVEQIDEGYSLQAIRDNERLRAAVSRVDLDTVTFASGSSYVSQSQVYLLGDIAGAMLDVIDENPAAVFMIEGHTDAVGSEISNLTLSDRRAETVAQILVEAYDVPPENLVTQGYGESYLKVDTLGPSQANRRVTVRNISPILYSSN